MREEWMDPPPDTYGERWAGIYDELAEGLRGPPTQAQLDVLVSLADCGRVLELGIGTGRVALPLAAQRVDVHGVDASPSMVARLREKPGGAKIPVTIGDMAEALPDGPFRLVYVVFNTIFALLSQERQVACFRSVAGVLEPGGAFLLECFVPDPRRFVDGQCVRAIDVGADHMRIEVSRHDPVMQLVQSSTVLFSSAGRTVLPVQIRYAWPAELDLMAALAGLRLRDRWGGWEREPFTASSTSHVSVYERPT
jgi:SAM-dependent methyltransferase